MLISRFRNGNSIRASQSSSRRSTKTSSQRSNLKHKVIIEPGGRRRYWIYRTVTGKGENFNPWLPTQKTGVDKGMADSSINKRKIAIAIKHSIDSDTESEVNPKTSGTLKRSSRTTATTTTTTTRLKEKKVFALPGQKYGTPEEREPVRIFYESLANQIPTSDMAQFWMMEHGLLSAEKAKRTHEKKLKKQKDLRTGTQTKPVKPSNKLERLSDNGDIKANTRIVDESEGEGDDFIASTKRKKMIKSP